MTSIPSSQEFYDRAVADSEGLEWQPLFNGKDLQGWKVVLQNTQPGEDPEKIYQVADETIHVYRDTPAGKKMPFGVLLSDKDYSHYRLRFEYRWGEKKFAPREKAIRDAGLLYHTIGPEKVWPMSVECQVQENDTGDIFTVYTSVDAPVQQKANKFQEATAGGEWKNFYRPKGVTRVIKSETLEHEGWNTVEVAVRGDAAVHLVNGKVNNYCINLKAPQGENQELLPLTSGRIAFQAEGAELFYRNIEILPLPTATSTKTVFADESAAPVPALSPQDSLKAWQVREGYRMELVAAEPLTRDPVAIDWGWDGKLWVVEMADYPMGLDDQGQPGGRICFLEDTDADGKYDRSSVFMDGVNFPTGIVTWDKGVIVTAAPEIFYAEDTDGDGRYDQKNVLFSGFIEGNQQLRLNGLRWGLDGWLYCASGSHTPAFGTQSRIRSHVTGEDVALGSRDFRFHPQTGQLEPLSGPSQFGRNRDDWGNWFGVQNSFPLWHYVLEDRYLRRNPFAIVTDSRQLLTPANPKLYPVSEIEARMHNFHESGRFTSACSGMIYRDQLLFPHSDVTHAFTCDPVHNIVQHNLLRREGISFQMQRDAAEGVPDFLASTDRWCRPVMVRTGPDGALWVVDMYRAVIEHPHWLPKEGKKIVAPYLRAGDGRGRIYRVLPVGADPHPFVRIDQQTGKQLVELLNHTNGWIRDSAQRELSQRKDERLIPLLRETFLHSSAPLGRLHALTTLNQLGACDVELLRKGMQDPAAELRRSAIFLAEQQPNLLEQLAPTLAELTDDPAPPVQLQAVLTLGNVSHATAGESLSRLWQRETDSPHWRMALLSSLNSANMPVLMQTFDRNLSESDQIRRSYRELALQALLRGQPALIESRLNSAPETSEEWSRALILSSALLSQSTSEKTALAPQTSEKLQQLVKQSRELILSTEQPVWLRTLAIPLLFQWPDQTENDMKVVSELLLPSTPVEIQHAIITRLGELQNKEMAEELLLRWSEYSPATKNRVLQVIAARPAWYPVLASAFDQQWLQPGEISLTMQQQLLRHRDKNLTQGLREHFEQISGSPSAENTAQLIKKLPEAGDFAAGRAVFQKHCSDCHQFRNQGFAVGPNLESLSATTRTRNGLIEAIVEPNRAVEAKYLSYTLVLIDGRSDSGLITNESEHSLTLQRAKGETTSVLRASIEELRSTGKSLMPEGFDRQMQPEELADLLTYLLSAEPVSANKAPVSSR